MCKKYPLDIFVMLIPKVNQAKCYSFLIHPIPPHIPDCQHVFLLLIGMPLRQRGGWLSFIQKFPRDKGRHDLGMNNKFDQSANQEVCYKLLD